MSLYRTLALALALICGAAQADISVVDDKGRTVTLRQPARRIVSLAPSVTELLFAAGAGDDVVGAVEYSDYPDAAKRIPRVGNNIELDLERIAGLRPDLIVVWLHGNAQRQLDSLAHLGIPLFYSEPRRLDEIPRALRQLGRLAGTEQAAEAAAGGFSARLARLRARYAGRPRVRVFYQVWEQPLMTLNGRHIISDALLTCGGENVFADQGALVPQISAEAVMAADPEVIITAAANSREYAALDRWRATPSMTAVARHNLFFVNSDLVSRATPRLLDATRQICEALDKARERRPIR